MKVLVAIAGLLSLYMLRGHLDHLAISDRGSDRYEILDDAQQGRAIRDVAVRVRERLEKRELIAIANEIMSQNRHRFSLTQVKFYLPDMSSDYFPWASAHHESQLVVRIHGSSERGRIELDQTAFQLLENHDSLVGVWQCEVPTPQRALLVDRAGKVILIRCYAHRAPAETELLQDAVDPFLYSNIELDLEVSIQGAAVVIAQGGREIGLLEMKELSPVATVSP